MTDTKIDTNSAAASAASVTDDINDEARQVFLNALAVSGDIILAATAAGHADDAAFFKLRQTDVAFAALWDAASDVAYMRLESALLAGALRAAKAPVTQPATPSDVRMTAMWHRLSLSLLAAHRLIRGKAKGSPINIASDAKQTLLNTLNLMRNRSEAESANLAYNA